MNPSATASAGMPRPGAPILEDLVEELTNRVQAGESVDLDAWAAKYPEHAAAIRDLLPALQMMAGLSDSGGSLPEAGLPEVRTLGDFRIVREVGRGGMGVVYEAEQMSLGRRVALKVLPFAATMDPRQLQRFHNEARAAASLDHPHIVHVHAVGCERAVHFYAMQFIDGQTLAAMIADLRKRGGRPALPEEQPTTPHVPGAPAAETAERAATTTERARPDPAYFRRVAEWGIQAAEALDHAHQLGIVHRDVKPANLLVDGRGGLWVTDFGLAHIQSDARLTMTGDLVGTLRYMSPEQALAKRVVIDHRTDVYSLGATLYELLALEPAFTGNDRQELLRQIAFEDPKPPRRLNKAIPADLETIVLKATEKNPADRYATAKELADDLRQWLDDRPIRARRPSWRQVATRWVRRHKQLVGTCALLLLLAAVLGGGTKLWWVQKRSGAEGEARAAVREAVQLRQEERWTEALSAVRRAKGVLVAFEADPQLLTQIEQLTKDLEMAHRLEEAHLQASAEKDGYFDKPASFAAYAEAFQWYGLDPDNLDSREAGERVRSCAIRMQMVAALDDWAYWQRAMHCGSPTQLLAIARLADPDPWRNRLRDIIEKERLDVEALGELVVSAQRDEIPPVTAILLANLAEGTPAAERMVAVLIHSPVDAVRYNGNGLSLLSCSWDSTPGS